MLGLLYDFGALRFGIIDVQGRRVRRGATDIVMSKNGKAIRTTPGGKVDTTMDTFRNMIMNMSDFYTGTREPFRDKEFADCEVLGPAIVTFTGHVRIWPDSYMGYNDFVQIKRGAKVSNVIVFENITIRRSTFRGITILVPEDIKHSIPADANWITHLTNKEPSGEPGDEPLEGRKP
jgi:hypothetical protein